MTKPNIHCEFYKKRGCTCRWCGNNPFHPDPYSSRGVNSSQIEMSRSDVQKLITVLKEQIKNMTDAEVAKLLETITKDHKIILVSVDDISNAKIHCHSQLTKHNKEKRKDDNIEFGTE